MNHALQPVYREGRRTRPLNLCGPVLGSGFDGKADVHDRPWTVIDDLCLRLVELSLQVPSGKKYGKQIELFPRVHGGAEILLP